MQPPAYSNTASATTQGAAPAAPSNLAAVAVSSSQISITWTDAATNETGFRIERCTGTGCTAFAEIKTVGANTTSYQSTASARLHELLVPRARLQQQREFRLLEHGECDHAGHQRAGGAYQPHGGCRVEYPDQPDLDGHLLGRDADFASSVAAAPGARLLSRSRRSE